MPVLDAAGCCVGLIDAESWTPGFFDEACVAIVARCALDVAVELAPEKASPVLWWRSVSFLIAVTAIVLALMAKSAR